MTTTDGARMEGARTRIQELIERASPDAKKVVSEVYVIERRQLFARDVGGAVRREIVEEVAALIREVVQ